MKIIINRGFDKAFSRILIIKNADKAIVSHFKKDYCEIKAEDGDRIVIKLGFLDTSKLTVGSFVYHKGIDIAYVSPTTMCKIWEFANFKLLPYLCLLLFVFKVVIESDTYEWFCTCMIVLTALSLICFMFCTIIPYVRNQMYKLEVL